MVSIKRLESLLMARARLGNGFSWRPTDDYEFSASNICFDPNCQFLGGASFDADGNILIPNRTGLYNGEIAVSGDGTHWVNDAPPAEINPISCCYKVTLEGLASHPIEGSWVRDCADFNNVYY